MNFLFDSLPCFNSSCAPINRLQLTFMYKFTYVLILLFAIVSAFGQNVPKYDDFLDRRDGRIYQTIKIENTIWIAENIKYNTEESEMHQVHDAGIEIDEYFYPYHELDDVCPDDFRLVNTRDWENYFQYLIKLKNIPASSVRYANLIKKGRPFVVMQTSDSRFTPFENPNPLNLNGWGHTEARKIVAVGSMNVWTKHNDSSDAKYHLHLDDYGYSIHTHKHHIISKKKRLRKFSVRCVRDDLDH